MKGITMAQLISINGEEVRVGFIVMNTLWIVVSLALLPFLATQLYRVYKLATHSANASAYHGLCVQWAQISSIWLCYFISGFDVSHAYIDESEFMVGILLGESSVLFLNVFIFYFFSHIEAYIVSSKDLGLPTWLLRARLVSMVANLVGGNIFLAVGFAIRRVYLARLVQLWVGTFALACGFALGGLAYTLARRVQKEREGNEMDTVGRELRRFQWASLLSASLGVIFGAILIPFGLLPMVNVDKNLPFTLERDHVGVFTFHYVSWMSYLLLFWVFKVFWIPKQLFKSEVNEKRQGSNAHPHALSKHSYTTRSLLV